MHLNLELDTFQIMHIWCMDIIYGCKDIIWSIVTHLVFYKLDVLAVRAAKVYVDTTGTLPLVSLSNSAYRSVIRIPHPQLAIHENN